MAATKVLQANDNEFQLHTIVTNILITLRITCTYVDIQSHQATAQVTSRAMYRKKAILQLVRISPNKRNRYRREFPYITGSYCCKEGISIDK